jgi:hypothetical protein
MSQFEILMRAGLGLILLGVWLLLSYFPPPGGASSLVAFIGPTLGLLAGHSLRTGAAS